MKIVKNLRSDKRALSTVVTALIIVLLVLVAIGIVWVVVRGVLESGTAQIDIRAKCLQVDVRATAVDALCGASCTVTLERRAGGDEIAGVKLVFFEGDTSGGVSTEPDNIVPLTTKTTLPLTTGLTTPDKVEVTAYFTDDSGTDQLCSTSSEFNI